MSNEIETGQQPAPMSDEVEIARKLAESFAAKAGEWSVKHERRSLVVASPSLGVEVREYGGRFGAGARRYTVTHAEGQLDISEPEAREVLSEAMRTWHETEQAAAMEAFKAQLAAHLGA